MTQKPDVQLYEIHTMNIKKTADGYVFKKEMKRRGLLFFLLFFTTFWNGVTWTIIGSMMKTKSFTHFEPEMLLFLLHPAIGLGSLYYTMVIAFNKYKLVINDKVAQTTTGPLPWGGNFKVNRSRVGQIYVEQYVAYYRDDEPVYRFSVKAISLGGNIHNYIMKGLQHYEEALIIEKTLEELWQIEDREVKNEYRQYA